MFVNPITFGLPKGDGVDVFPSLRSLIDDSETTTYGEPSGEASILLTTNSFFINYHLFLYNFNFDDNFGLED
jgi:hypothetical protein